MEKKHLRETPAFYFGTTLHLQPEQHKDFFNTSLTQENIEQIYSLTKPKELEQTKISTPLKKSYVCDKYNLYLYLKDLADVLKESDSDLPIHIDCNNHSVHLKYDKSKNTWQYADTNFFGFGLDNPYVLELNHEELAHTIFVSFNKDLEEIPEFVTFTTTVLAKDTPNLPALKKKFDAFNLKYPIKKEHAEMYDGRDCGLLYLACQTGDLETVQKLLSLKKIDINHCVDGVSPLSAACQYGHLDIVKLLLNDKRIDVDIGERAPLAAACHFGHMEIVNELLHHKKIDFNQAMESGEIELIDLYDYNMIKEVLLNPTIDPSEKRKIAETLLYYFCKDGNAEKVELLFGLPGINVDTTDSVEFFIRSQGKGVDEKKIASALKSAGAGKKTTPLQIACASESTKGNEKLFHLLLNNKASLIHQDSSGKKALDIAIENDNDTATYALLEYAQNNKLNYNDLMSPNSLKKVQTDFPEFFVQKTLEDEQRPSISKKSPYATIKASGRLHTACRKGDIEFVRELLSNQNISIINKVNEENETPLFIACQNGHLAIVNELLKHKNIEINKANNFGETPFFTACQFGNLEIAQKLLNYKIDINQTNKNGETPLFIACLFGREDLIELLLNQENINLEKEAQNGTTPLQAACQSPFTKGKEQLFQKLLVNEGSVTHKNKEDETALDIAMKSNNETATRLILTYIEDKKLDPAKAMSLSSLLKAKDKYPSFKGLEKAAKAQLEIQASAIVDKFIKSSQKGKRTEVPFLDNPKAYFQRPEALYVMKQLKRKGSLDKLVAPNNTNIFHLACANGHLDIIREFLLYKKTFPINTRNDDRKTPLHFACQAGKNEVVELLLTAPKIKINAADKDGNTPLQIACFSPETKGNEKLFQLLLAHNANITHKNKEGETALDIAISCNNETAIRSILKHIAEKELDPIVDPHKKTTIFHLACAFGYLDIVRDILSQKTFLINMENEDLKTPLHFACQAGKNEVVEFLLTSPTININAFDNDEYTPLQIACFSPDTKGNEKLFHLLLAHNANITHKNIHGQTALDIAIDTQNDTAIRAILDFVCRNQIEATAAMSPKTLTQVTAEYPEFFESDTKDVKKESHLKKLSIFKDSSEGSSTLSTSTSDEEEKVEDSTLTNKSV
ncbi:ankyrin repeat domain-containing protein [Legionella anisa]|uniref:ankyrin repeat domain-containing protein n=1 Tax=Legionella anisa TaxID=28082 RepID=UPI00138EFB66|nr:ankyrin repeat domain-containing protein [Legionella anisa]UAK78046.1 ankyrin repeat domain-containing protein [Legionella anisa]